MTDNKFSHEHKHIIFIKKWLYQIFQDEKVIDKFLRAASQFNSTPKYTIVLLGVGSNSKSALAKLIHLSVADKYPACYDGSCGFHYNTYLRTYNYLTHNICESFKSTPLYFDCKGIWSEYKLPSLNRLIPHFTDEVEYCIPAMKWLLSQYKCDNIDALYNRTELVDLLTKYSFKKYN